MCSCNGGAAGAQYEAVAGDGTRLEVAPGQTTGTVEQARTAAAATRGGWVRKAVK